MKKCIILTCILSLMLTTVSNASESGTWTFGSDPGFTERQDGTDTNFTWSIASGNLSITMTREADCQRLFMPLTTTYSGTSTFRVRARYRRTADTPAQFTLGFFDANGTTLDDNNDDGDVLGLSFESPTNLEARCGTYYNRGDYGGEIGTWYIGECTIIPSDGNTVLIVIDDANDTQLAYYAWGGNALSEGVSEVGFGNYDQSASSATNTVEYD